MIYKSTLKALLEKEVADEEDEKLLLTQVVVFERIYI